MFKSFFILLVALTLASCGGDKKGGNNTSGDAALNGAWQWSGSGYVLKMIFSGSQLTTTLNCSSGQSVTMSMSVSITGSQFSTPATSAVTSSDPNCKFDADAGSTMSYKVNGNQLEVTDNSGNPITFTRIN
jgi:hypothetical protein